MRWQDSTVTLRLPIEDKLALELVAQRRGLSISELLREMIDVVIAADAEVRGSR